MKFADADSISPWAKDAVKVMHMADILMGKDAGCFDPKGTAKRAEVAAVLHHYVKLVIDIQTTQGFE